MKKIIIILMTVFLGTGICLAQDTVPNVLSDSNQKIKSDSTQISPNKENIPQVKEIAIQQSKETEQPGSGQSLFLIIAVIVLAILVSFTNATLFLCVIS